MFPAFPDFLVKNSSIRTALSSHNFLPPDRRHSPQQCIAVVSSLYFTVHSTGRRSECPPPSPLPYILGTREDTTVHLTTLPLSSSLEARCENGSGAHIVICPSAPSSQWLNTYASPKNGPCWQKNESAPRSAIPCPTYHKTMVNEWYASDTLKLVLGIVPLGSPC